MSGERGIDDGVTETASRPPPEPWIVRPTNSNSIVGLTAQTTVPSAKIARPIR